MLDRLELATERRDPVIADQARQLRNRYFDQPLILQRQAEAYEQLERHLNALMEDPERADRAEHIEAVVTAPQLLAPQIIERMSTTGAREHPVMLEIMTRRWYRERELTGFWDGVTSDGTAYVTTSFEADGRRHHLAAAFVDTQDLDDIAGAISRRAAQYPQGESVYVDLYAAATAGEELANELKAALERADVPPLVQRIVLDVPAPIRGVSAADAITLHRSLDGGWELDRELQFVHPEMAERLNLWRMSEFALERIASPADVYLFRGVGRSNPKDERLFALAEVRELTIVRDENGPRRLAARARAHAGRGAGVAAPLPGPPLAARAPAVEPRAAEPVAGDRPRAGRGGRADRPLRPRDRGPRHRDRDHPRPHARPARRQSSATASCGCSRPPAAA